VMGLWNFPEAARIVYLGLFALQHRGQESSGIVSMLDDGKKKASQCVHRGLGLVADVFNESVLASLSGASAIGHNRYSTTGQNLLLNAQPLVAELSRGPLALAHNGNIVNSESLKKELKNQGAIFQGTNDSEIFLHLIARDRSKNITETLKNILPQIIGAYSLTLLTGDSLVAVRDPLGFRPLVLGTKKNDQGGLAYVVASETCAFDLIGADFVREIEPGEILVIDQAGLHSERIQSAEPSKKAQCVFEHVYFSRPDSVVFGQSVYQTRKEFGRHLARQRSVAADVVIPVPDSGVPAALGFAKESGLPFELGIIRNHYVGRTFIQPHQAVRSFGVRVKLNAQASVLAGQRVIVVDDSLVRGTTSQKIISLIRQAGAKEVHMRIASPPTKGPCYYGVDTPHKTQLIASHQSTEEIRKFIGADSLEYLSIEALYSSVNGGAKNFCAACFDGNYPTKLDDEVLEKS
jgi:amidophosphoribosyltransferase